MISNSLLIFWTSRNVLAPIVFLGGHTHTYIYIYNCSTDRGGYLDGPGWSIPDRWNQTVGSGVYNGGSTFSFKYCSTSF
jgi:hypothetical protein